MSYTLWDEAHDRFCAVQDELNCRQAGWVPDTPEEAEKDNELRDLLQLLELEVQFLEAHPEIKGRDARNPSEIAAAKAAFLEFIKNKE